MAKGKSIKSGYVDLNVPKVRNWAEYGKNRAEIATILGITVEELDKRLDELALRNLKSANSIRRMLDRNDKASKPRRKAQHQPNTTNTSASAPAPTPTPAAIAPAETTPKEAPTAKQTASTEVEELQQQIEQSEQNLRRIELTRAEARKTIDDSKKKAFQYESELKDLLSKLQNYKASFEAEQQRLAKSEQKLIACEAQMTAEEKRLSALKARLDAIKKPEIYVCSGDIQAENCIVPETIDVSDWAKLISSLPEEIGEELRKRDAETLLRLRAITRLIEREDVEIIFEHETLQRAYEAMLSNEQ